jgi:acyl carrier protein
MKAPTERTAEVLRTVVGLIVRILDAYGVDEAEIGRETSFHDDLEMESIDLVTLAGLLATEYGDSVNLAEFLADKDLEAVIGLTVGDIVDYVASQIDQD